MATNLPSFFSIQFLEQLLKSLVNFTLLKYVKSQRNYGFLITKELIFGFQILDLKDHFSAALKTLSWVDGHCLTCKFTISPGWNQCFDSRSEPSSQPNGQIISLLNFIFADLHGYQITPSLGADKQRHRLRCGHIFEKLNSLSFPCDFRGIFKFFAEQLKRGNSMECIFVGDHVKYFSFSPSFPGFFCKN